MSIHSDLTEGFKKFDDADKYKFDYVKDEVRMFYKGEYYGNIIYYKNASKYGFQTVLFCGIKDVEYDKILSNTISVMQELNKKVA